MSGFDPAAFVEPLAWTFRPAVDAEGVVPEPSEATILRYHRAFLAQLGLEPGADAEKRKARLDELANMPEADQVAHMARLREIVADACGGSPSKKQVDELPFRLLRAFANWLLEEFTNPSKPSAATSG